MFRTKYERFLFAKTPKPQQHGLLSVVFLRFSTRALHIYFCTRGVTYVHGTGMYGSRNNQLESSRLHIRTAAKRRRFGGASSKLTLIRVLASWNRPFFRNFLLFRLP